MSDIGKFAFAAALAGLTTLVLTPVILIDAFVLERLWRWFAPAPFIALSYGASVGVCVLLRFVRVTSNAAADGPPKDEVLQRRAVRVIVVPGICLLLGWLTHLAFGGGAP